MKTILSSLIILFCAACFGDIGNQEHFTPINLSKAANMGFVDKTPRDGKGGWFDDGEGDLRFFLVDRTQKIKPPENVVMCGVPFRIIDPDNNNGKAVVVFGSKFKPEISLRSTGPFRIDRKLQYFYLLHATGWSKDGQTAAEFQIIYDDNTKVSRKIINGRDVSDWYNPQEVPNAVIAWQGITLNGGFCGIYFSSVKNPHPEKKVREISFQGGFDDLNYALIAVTAASDSTRIQPVCQLKQVYSIPEKRPETKPSEILNPMNFPSYQQKLEVKFASLSDAEKAELRIPPLPHGKKFALTLRWDDCNPNHINQLRIMRKNGLRGTFMLYGFGKSYQKTAKELLKTGGCSIGNHSLKHVRYNGVPKNTIYEYIVRQQVLIESMLDTVCISYVFPGGLGSPSQEEAHTAGRSLNAGGIYSGPFMSRTHTSIGLDNRRMFPTYYFSANDRNPDEKLFAEGFTRTRFMSMRNPDVPRITFGIHFWQDKNGMKKLDGLYAKYLCSPEFWNATENEYAAYRYSFYNANPVRTKLDGNAAVYTLMRFEPAFLGAETPLEIHFTEKPLEVRLNGKPIRPDSNGNFTIPHDPGRRLPFFVEALEKNDHSTKFPGLSVKLSVDLEKNSAEAEIFNQSGKALDHSVFTLILPPHWKQMNQSIPIGMLKSGELRKVKVDLGVLEQRPGYDAPKYYILGKFDFSGPEYSGRIYRILE